MSFSAHTIATLLKNLDGQSLKALMRSHAGLHRAFKGSKYLVMKRLPRAVLDGMHHLLPLAFPLCLPRGTFLALTLLQDCSASRPGRVVLLDHENHSADAYSVTILSKLGQQVSQLRPVSWIQHLNARLFGLSLALCVAGDLCPELVCRDFRVKDDSAYSYLPVCPPLRLHGHWTSLSCEGTSEQTSTSEKAPFAKDS